MKKENQNEMKLEILNIDVNNIKKKQYDALTDHAIKKLKTIITFLENKDLNSIGKMMRFSPSGDCMGGDNYFINFDFSNNGNGDDIGKLIRTLAEIGSIELSKDLWWD